MSFCLMTLQANGAEEKIIKVLDASQQPVPNAVIIVAGVEQPERHSSQAVIDQINEQFSPQLLVVKAGAEVAFPNSDKTRHHVYSFSPAKVFELPLYASSDLEVVTFDVPGIVHLGCNIHDQMSATLVVSDGQLFAISDANGEVQLPASIDVWPKDVLVWHKQTGHDEPVFYPLNFSAGTGKIELTFSYVAELAKPRKLTLKEKLEKYKNK